jgi:hypothetical protein
MPGAGRAALLYMVSLFVLGVGMDAGAQHFGRNKVEYVDFDFKVLETEHFAVYYYSSEEIPARLASRLAERWYARLSRVLGHTLTTRQPLILYGSQPEFAQTNVVAGFLGEGVGGVTESAKRRIVLPFAPTLAETDHVLGHEIAHAFQFDITRRQGGVLTWPLWAVEGMAEYLSVGPNDIETAMWLKDAVRSELLPTRPRETERRFSPYRYGSAVWAYLADRFGERVIGDILKAERSGGLERRIQKVTGVEFAELFSDWRAAAHQRYRADPVPSDDRPGSPLLRGADTGRLHLGPSLSPDGREAIFFSEKDRLSLDLFLADATTGSITRKLATTTASARFESLQPIRSAGSWSPRGNRFVFAAVERGQPALVVLDMDASKRPRQIPFPQLGQILTPAWSPDDRTIAFSALNGGVTDLYVYELDTGRLRQLTNDVYADLQPAWSPDGRQIAFVTDRFSTDLDTLTFRPGVLALMNVSSGTMRALPAFDGAKHVNPQWSADGGVYFISDPAGISNVYRMDATTGLIHQMTDARAGVTGLASTSPALSVARDAPAMAYTVYRAGRYEMHIQRADATLTGTALAASPRPSAASPREERSPNDVDTLLGDSEFGLPPASSHPAQAYEPNLFLEALGQPYLSSSGGPFGTAIRGGGSLLFSDVLGERKLAVSAQVSNRLRDVAIGVRYLNRERRWNWGAALEVQPSIRRLPRSGLTEREGQPALSRETHYFERIHTRMGGLLAYPLNQGRRFEFDGGVRHIRYRQAVHSTVRSLQTGRVLERLATSGSGGKPATFGEVSMALVGDTAVFGPTSPIVGSRSRFEVTPTFGDLSFVRVLLDHRRYVMPIKPYTIAARVVHMGHYGRDADDPRILPAFLGSRQFVHGYGWGSLQCEMAPMETCGAFEELLGSRLLVGNMEVRVPVMGVLAREIDYGSVPAEGFLFADSGLVWSRSRLFAATGRERRLVTSVGAGVRVNAFGFPLELAVVRALNAPARGWSFDFSFRPAF